MTAAADEPCLAVVMPCFDEAATVRRAVERVLALPVVAEVIVVDDGSTDGSRHQLAAVDDPRLRVVSHPTNRGKGAALRTGFALTTAPFVAVHDADLEYDAADLPRLLAPLADGRADVVYGARFITSRARRVLYHWHQLGNRVLTTLSDITTNLNLSDIGTGHKLFRREVLHRITIEEDRFAVEPELTAKVAALGCRVFEMGIAYDGRSYAEGKKATWRDGVHALVAIPRYAWTTRQDRRRDAARNPAAFAAAAIDEEQAATLHSLEGATNYADWLADLARPHLAGHLLEVGAGHGTFSERLADLGSATVVSEPDRRAVALLRDRLIHRRDITVVEADLTAALADDRYDGIVLLNVLEHIPDDDEALALIAGGLAPGGRVVLLVPAFELLYSRFDAAVGHYRRYRLPALVAAVERAGLSIEVSRYVNSAGFLAWLVTARLLRLTPTRSTLATAYDRAVIPTLRRLEARRAPPFGQSCFVVARRVATADA